MKEINQRVKELRKALNLNQSDFAKKIGIAQNSLSLIETGKNVLTQQNINLICLTFSVNENWLRFGKGEMFMSKQERFIKLFERLNSNMQDIAIRQLESLVEAQKLQENKELENAEK